MPESPDVAVDDLRKRARRRLVGAVLLALIAAVALPVFLESDPKPLGQDVSIQIPSPDGGKFASVRPGESPGVPAAAPEAQATPPSAAAVAGAADKAGGAPVVPSKAGTEVAATDPTAPTGSADARTAGKARDARPVSEADQRAAAALKGAQQRVIGAAGSSADPALASSAQKAAPAAQKAAPSPAKPDTAATKSEPVAVKTDAASRPPRGSFAVQVGALADAHKANEMAGKLRAAGYPAQVSEVATASGKVYRVRVPGYADRQAAQAGMAKLRGAGYPGIVAEVK
jgi:DedD protein